VAVANLKHVQTGKNPIRLVGRRWSHYQLTWWE